MRIVVMLDSGPLDLVRLSSKAQDMYRKLSSKTLLTHPRLKVVKDQVEFPDGQQGDYLWFAGQQDGVTIIPRNHEGKILVEQEYSYLPGEALYQFPGGGMEDGEQLEAAANGELAEELSYYANRLTPIGSYFVDHRRSLAKNYIFLGEDLVACESATQDRYEVDIQFSWLTEAEVDALIARGEVVNASMLAAWMVYKSRRP